MNENFSVSSKNFRQVKNNYKASLTHCNYCKEFVPHWMPYICGFSPGVGGFVLCTLSA